MRWSATSFVFLLVVVVVVVVAAVAVVGAHLLTSSGILGWRVVFHKEVKKNNPQ
jgi:hypothetical protein